MTGRDRVALHLTAGVVTVLMLAPLLWPGYVLSYDLVFVPHQPLRWDLVAPDLGLPRAVPEDAVVSVLNVALPGWLLERIALVGIVYGSAVGAGRVVPARRLATRLVAAVGYAWTAFLAERLLLGQWGLLVAYAALPFLVAGALRLRAGEPRALGRLLIPAGICAITPTGGLLAVATTAALTVRRGPVREWLPAVTGAVLFNLPWVVAALTTAASGRGDPAGVAAFSARGENWAGPVVSLAGTGGVWNGLTTPSSRTSVVIPIVTLVLLGLGVAGVRSLRDRWPGGAGTALLWLAGVSFVVAALGVLPGGTALLEWAVVHIPGAGLLRDGQKYLIPYALALSLTAALGVERIAARLTPLRARLVLGTLILLPVAALPDLAIGAAGALRPVSYPADWDHVAQLVAADPGPVLALPFYEYRSFTWNRDRPLLDPAPRYLPAPVLTDDDLMVGRRRVAGENPRAAQVRSLLGAGEPVSRTGLKWVLVERDAGGSVPTTALTGLRKIYSGQFLDLYANPDAAGPEPAKAGRRWLVGLAFAFALAVWFLAIASLCGLPTPW